jgi:hypothetical protein
MKDFQIEISNILTKEECRKVIEWFENSIHKKHSERSNETYEDELYKSDYIIITDIDNIESEFVKSVYKKIIQDSSDKDISFDCSSIVATYPNTGSPLHYDQSSTTSRTWSVVTYLNDDYEGGEYYVPGYIKYKPTTGSSLKMYGSEHLHGVFKTSTNSNKRYIIVIWFIENDR